MSNPGRPAIRRQQVLVVIDAAAVLGQVPTYGGIARAVGMKDWRQAKRICRELNWPGEFCPVLQPENLV